MPNKSLPTVYATIEQTLHFCCGVMEYGEFSLEKDIYDDREPLTKIKKYGIGYFVATFVKGKAESTMAQKRLRKDHTLVFSTPYITNKSHWAGRTEDGEKNKVKLCVFKFGK